jgi:DNA repair exonuclease SbcCD ATPase subunit
MGAELIHSRPHDDVESLRVRAAQLEATLAERDNEVTRLKADLDAFRIRYRQEVGLLHERLDELEAAIDEAEMGVRAEKPTTPVDASPAADQPPVDSAPKFTSDAVRKLFRDVAKAIHPDLAGDDLTRNRRHMPMIEANRAYALGDEQRLRLILEAWQNSPEAVSGSDAEAVRERLTRRMAQIEEQLEACASELADVKASSLWHLKAMVDEAAASGKDLVADMVRRLRRDILVAQNRLDAITWRPDAQ